MLGSEGLRIALPSKGRLHEGSVELLRSAGLQFRISDRRLFAVCSDTGTRIILSNVADIPVLVAEGVVDLGITGSDQVAEKGVSVVTHENLGFGHCKLTLAVHRDAPYKAPSALAGKVVGSSFVNLAARYFAEQGTPEVHVVPIQGAVEGMVLLGMVDAIVDIVETGSSLVANDLVALDTLLEAEAVIIGHPRPRDPDARDRLLRRIQGVLVAARYSLLEYNCPRDKLDEATRITPGFSSPTVQKQVDDRWFAVRVLVEKVQIHQIMDQLEALGCVAILESDLRHTRL